jgi:hypothetical protein
VERRGLGVMPYDERALYRRRGTDRQRIPAEALSA